MMWPCHSVRIAACSFGAAGTRRRKQTDPCVKPVAQGFRSSRRGIDAAGASFAGKETGGRWVEKVQECAFSPFC
jgi:hypothetical protein